MNGEDVEVTARVSAGTAGAAAEPCERCGTDVVLQDPVALVRALADMPPAPRRDRWTEVHARTDPDGAQIHWREHTPELCARARAGDPVPVDWVMAEDDL
jgi:hypothetical protein